MLDFLKTYARKALTGLLVAYTAQRRAVLIIACVVLGFVLTMGVSRCAHANPPGNYFLTVGRLAQTLGSEEPSDVAARKVFLGAVSDTGQDLTHCAPLTVTVSDLEKLAAQAFAAAPPTANAARVMAYAMAQAYPCGVGA